MNSDKEMAEHIADDMIDDAISAGETSLDRAAVQADFDKSGEHRAGVLVCNEIARRGFFTKRNLPANWKRHNDRISDGYAPRAIGETVKALASWRDAVGKTGKITALDDTTATAMVRLRNGSTVRAEYRNIARVS